MIRRSSDREIPEVVSMGPVMAALAPAVKKERP